MEKQFAFFLMGEGFDPQRDQVVWRTPGLVTRIYTVRDLEQACQLAATCAAQGVGAIELCGAFGQAGARRVRQAAGEQVAVGYVTHDPEQDPLFLAFWGEGTPG